jgi:type IV pilus assembly protein PilV
MKAIPFSLQRGISMIEVLVTIVIVGIGLLGFAGLQSRLQVSEMDSYQRSQAVVLLEDMASRIATNRVYAANYVTGTSAPLGAGMTCPTSTATRQATDAKEWCEALQGAAETSGTSKVGALIGGRGCVEDMGSGVYRVTVAWQGLGPVSSPAVACGANLYDLGQCTNDLCRRAVTTVVRIANLT